VVCIVHPISRGVPIAEPLGFEFEAWAFYILQKADKEGAIGHTG
jgi:hypothetical protein